MANTSGQTYGSGFRFGQIFELNSNGRIKGNSATVPYLGAAIIGGKTLNLTEQKMRVLNHINADRVGAADFLPPTSISEANMTVSAIDQQMQKILTGNKQVFVGEMATQGRLTSNQGYEPVVALLATQQALDPTTRLRTWHSYAAARAKVIPHNSAFMEKEADANYDVIFIPSSYNLLGTQFTTVANGFTDAQYDDWDSEYVPMVAAWLGNNAATAFAFPVAYPAVTTSKISVTLNGVLQVEGVYDDYIATTSGITFNTAPATNDDIAVKWEIAAA